MSPKKTQDSSNAFKQNKSGTAAMMGKMPLIIILVIVVVAFVLVPLLSGFTGSGSSNLVFGTYGDEKIEYTSGSYFYNQVNMLNNMYRDQLSQSDELLDFYRYYIWSSAYQQSVVYAAKRQELSSSGFLYSERGISRLIVNSGYYDDEDGNFDESAYASATVSQRDEIKISILDSAYVNQFDSDRLGGVYKSQEQVDFIMNISPVEKQFRYVKFTSSQYPSDKVLEYARSHSNLFTAYPLARITMTDKDRAEAVIKEIKDGTKKFADAAAASSTDMYSVSGGVMGDVYRYTLVDELGEEKSEAVFNLADGEISPEPIETDYGWYIYMVNGPAIEPDFTDEALVATVRNWMNWNESATIDTWVMDEAETFIASIDENVENSFTLEAFKASREVKNTEYFPLNWGSSPLAGNSLANESDSIIQGAAQSDDFFLQAFSLEENGDVSEPIILENAVVVLELMGSRDSESKISEYGGFTYLQQIQEQIYSSLVTESPLYEDSFMETYYNVFPPEGTEES